MIKWYGNGGGWGGDAPVYDVDFDDLSDDSYPAVWITVQVHEPTPTRTGRDCISIWATSTATTAARGSIGAGGSLPTYAMTFSPDGES